MKPTWIEILLRVSPAWVDLTCAILADLGCTGVTVEERRLDTFVPPDPDEPPAGDYLLKTYFPHPDDPNDLFHLIAVGLAELAPMLDGKAPEIIAFQPVEGDNWAEKWKQHFGRMHIGSRLVIRPTWEPYQPKPGEAVLLLDPGMAFGTGTHATTRLCLEVLAELFESGRPPERVLDVGTGSGILAMAAAALGADRVLACDIDPQACQVARENARLNGLEDRIETTVRPLEELEGGFQVVLANILAEENARLATTLTCRLAEAGVLVLSGILGEKEDLVARAFSTSGLAGPEIRRSEDWSCLIYRKA